MVIRTRIVLFAITLFLLVSACTPQLVKQEETPNNASDSSETGSTTNITQKTESADTVAQNTGIPTPSDGMGKTDKKPYTIPVYNPKPSEVTVKPKTKPESRVAKKPATKPVPKVATKAKVEAEPKIVKQSQPKRDQPSRAAGTSNAKKETAPRDESDSEGTDTAQNEALRNSEASADSGEKGKATDAPQSTAESTPEADTVETDTVVETPQGSMDDPLELAMLTEKKAMAEDARANQPAVRNTTLDMAALPLSFGDYWSLDRAPNPVNDQTQCLLASRSVNISDGYDKTDVQMLLTAHSLYVKTESNIDLSYPGTGVRLDDGTLVPFERVVKEKTAIISGDIAILYEQMAPSRLATVRLGFWPTWPVTETQEARFSLNDFGDAVEALWLCEKM